MTKYQSMVVSSCEWRTCARSLHNNCRTRKCTEAATCRSSLGSRARRLTTQLGANRHKRHPGRDVDDSCWIQASASCVSAADFCDFSSISSVFTLLRLVHCIYRTYVVDPQCIFYRSCFTMVVSSYRAIQANRGNSSGYYTCTAVT